MTINTNGYSPGHPWFYKLGGAPLPLKHIQIRARVQALTEFRTMDDKNENLVMSMGVDKAMRLVDPAKKNDALLEARQTLLKDLWERDIPIYKRSRRNLSIWRRTGEYTKDQFSSAWGDMALKHNHVFWNFLNLWFIKLCLDDAKQPDLFGFGA